MYHFWSSIWNIEKSIRIKDKNLLNSNPNHSSHYLLHGMCMWMKCMKRRVIFIDSWLVFGEVFKKKIIEVHLSENRE